jgi:hypothetical protein
MVIVTCRIHYYDRQFFTLTSFGGLLLGSANNFDSPHGRGPPRPCSIAR